MNKQKAFLLIISIISFGSESMAQGNLLIFPKRIVFNESEIKKDITLINSGKEESTFVVNFIQRSMNSDGSFRIIDSAGPGQNFADSHLRIYPRTVTLKPNESQKVILQRRRNRNMNAGEYRSHILFMNVPKNEALDSSTENTEDGFSTSISTNIGISIPVIIRVGAVGVSADISDLKLEGTMLSFNINREGNISIYGNLLFQYTTENNQTTTIGKIKGIAVYTTIKTRTFKFNLNKIKNIDLSKGSITITYQSAAKTKQKNFSAATLLLKT